MHFVLDFNWTSPSIARFAISYFRPSTNSTRISTSLTTRKRYSGLNFAGFVDRKQFGTSQGVCVECGEVLPAKSLRQHLESRHWVNVKNQVCPTCGKTFRTKAEIEIHLAVVHEENVQSVICHYCGKELQHPKMLARVRISWF